MSDIRISGLPSATSVKGDDFLLVVSNTSGVLSTKKITANTLFSNLTIGNTTLHTGLYLPNTTQYSVGDWYLVANGEWKRVNANTITYTANVGNTVALSLTTKNNERLSVFDFGAVGGGVDDTVAFQKAALSGRPVAVPFIPEGYILSNTVNIVSNTSFYGIGGKPEIIMNSASVSRMFDVLARTRVSLINLRINGNKSVVPTGATIRIRDSSYSEIKDCEIINGAGDNTGSVVFSGNTTWSKCVSTMFIDCEGTSLGLSGTGVFYNTVEQCDFINGGGFGCRIGDGASHNRINNNRAVNTGLEGIATVWSSNYNTLNGNYITSAGDNGISISSSYNVVSGNICHENYKAGIGVWGEYNTISDNVITNNNQENTVIWAGVTILNGYGGSGQNNIVSGNITDDNQAVMTQYWNVRINPNAYGVWSQGLSVTSGEYRYFGLNIYQATNTGTTGSTAPVHTDGIVSDGVISWQFKNTVRSQMTPRTNFVAINHPGRNLSTQGMSDASGWVNNELFGYGSNKRFGSFPTANTGLQQYEWWMDTAANRVIKINS